MILAWEHVHPLEHCTDTAWFGKPLSSAVAGMPLFFPVILHFPSSVYYRGGEHGYNGCHKTEAAGTG